MAAEIGRDVTAQPACRPREAPSVPSLNKNFRYTNIDYILIIEVQVFIGKSAPIVGSSYSRL